MQLNQDRKHHDYDQSMRTSSTSGSEDSEDMSNYSEGEDFLPFPEFSHGKRRIRHISSFRASGRRSSLLDSFRFHPFRRSTNSSGGSDDLASHDSWANADEINAQTGIFNKKSISKLLEDAAKRGSFESEEPVLTVSLHDTPIRSQEPVQTPRRKLKSRRERRKSFTLGDRPASLKDLLSINRDQGIDVESELWDNFDDNISRGDASFKSGGTDYGTVLTA